MGVCVCVWGGGGVSVCVCVCVVCAGVGLGVSGCGSVCVYTCAILCEGVTFFLCKTHLPLVMILGRFLLKLVFFQCCYLYSPQLTFYFKKHTP